MSQCKIQDKDIIPDPNFLVRIVTTIDGFVKSHFATDIEPFWKEIQNGPGVKNFKLFVGVIPSF